MGKAENLNEMSNEEKLKELKKRWDANNQASEDLEQSKKRLSELKTRQNIEVNKLIIILSFHINIFILKSKRNNDLDINSENPIEEYLKETSLLSREEYIKNIKNFQRMLKIINEPIENLSQDDKNNYITNLSLLMVSVEKYKNALIENHILKVKDENDINSVLEIISERIKDIQATFLESHNNSRK